MLVAATGEISVEKKSVPVTWDATGGAAEIEVALPADTPTWDEFHPVLSKMSLRLEGQDAGDAREISFGFRDFKVDGKKFLLLLRPGSLSG